VYKVLFCCCLSFAHTSGVIFPTTAAVAVLFHGLTIITTLMLAVARVDMIHGGCREPTLCIKCFAAVVSLSHIQVMLSFQQQQL
jgi:hypothetical protein